VIGWRFAASDEKVSGKNVTPDPINGAECVREIYLSADLNYTGRFSVPVLWDKKTKTIVSNESSEIIRMLGTEFDGLLNEKHRAIRLVPVELEERIDEINAWVYVGLTSSRSYFDADARLG
jgi:putative glutathione S-transferase